MPDDPKQRAAATEDALRRAQIAVTGNRAADAERLASEILKTNPGHAGATKILGYALMMLGRHAEAIAPLEKLARSGRDAETETQLAIAFQHSGRSDDALVWLNRAIKRKPPFPAAFHELGSVLRSLGRYEEAIAALQQGLQAAPMMPEMFVQLGQVFNAMNDRPRARQCFAQAHAINPRHTEAMHALGAVLLDDHDFAAAAELFRRAVAANPADTMARINLGYSLLGLGQPDVGYACLRAATANGPQYFGKALKMSVSSGHGRFWLKPSAAAKFLRGEKS
jgi:tetratricopeptide (TPR) repeat protein